MSSWIQFQYGQFAALAKMYWQRSATTSFSDNNFVVSGGQGLIRFTVLDVLDSSPGVVSIQQLSHRPSVQTIYHLHRQVPISSVKDTF